MAGKNTAVFGIYSTQVGLERAIDALQAAGFRNTDISVLMQENEGTKDFAIEKGSKAPEGAATGAGTGALVGGGVGWLVGIGALAIPGIGPFIAAGPIMAALAGVGTGAVVGGLGGAMIGMGIPEYEAKRYEGRLAKGGMLLSVTPTTPRGRRERRRSSKRPAPKTSPPPTSPRVTFRIPTDRCTGPRICSWRGCHWGSELDALQWLPYVLEAAGSTLGAPAAITGINPYRCTIRPPDLSRK